MRFYIVNILGHLTFENLWQDENAARYTRTAAELTAEQMRVLEILAQLDGAADWRGVAAQERAARAVAAAVRTSIVVSTGPFIKKLLHNHSINIK